MLDKIEIVKPADIEKRSMEIITGELKNLAGAGVLHCQTVHPYVCGF